MFRDLDDTLKKILDDTEAPAELKAAEVSFELPDKAFAPEQPSVNLFLYEVHENRELRDPEPIIERDKVSGTFVRRRPPLRMDCSYMVTAWSNDTGPIRVANEHRLLSQALLWLSRFPIIPGKYLVGSLVDPPFPHRTEVALMNGSKSMGEFWTALGQPPRPSFNIVVTIAMELGAQAPEGPPVVSKDIHLLVKDQPSTEQRWFQIGGKVFESADPSKLIDGAQVRLVEKDQTVMTNAQGQFGFTELPAGNYTLEVSKAGFANLSKNIAVPGASLDAYDAGLAP